MTQDDFNQLVEEMNDAVAESIEQSMEAQVMLMESWTNAFGEAVPDDDVVESGIEGYTNAYEVWMNATEELFEQSTNIMDGEDVAPEEFRDIWLQSANQAYKEVMSTEAFAAANGQVVENVLELQQEVTELTEDSMAQMGMPTQTDVEEVGERLVELERRQHEVEQKLDHILDAVEE